MAAGDIPVDRQELVSAIRELRDHVQILWHAIDELREAFEHAVRNGPQAEWSVEQPRRITSMPIDPTAEDFATRLNALTANDISRDDAIAVPSEQERIDPKELIAVDFDDGDVAIFLPDGTWLATEDTRDDAVKEAEMKIIAYQNGAAWARAEIEQGRNHLQNSFPDIARQHGLIADPLTDDPCTNPANSCDHGPRQGELFVPGIGGDA